MRQRQALSAISYLAANYPDLVSFAYDFAEEIDRLAEAFGNEHTLRRVERKMAA